MFGQPAVLLCGSTFLYEQEYVLHDWAKSGLTNYWTANKPKALARMQIIAKLGTVVARQVCMYACTRWVVVVVGGLITVH